MKMWNGVDGHVNQLAHSTVVSTTPKRVDRSKWCSSCKKGDHARHKQGRYVPHCGTAKCECPQCNAVRQPTEVGDAPQPNAVP